MKAPVDGQLGNLEAQIGQSIAQGERIGQVITPELKVEAKIDEHYVERVMPGLPASFEREGKKYDMEVTKVYPEVREGQFRTDLHFAESSSGAQAAVSPPIPVLCAILPPMYARRRRRWRQSWLCRC